jgi:hypothetical protein
VNHPNRHPSSIKESAKLKKMQSREREMGNVKNDLGVGYIEVCGERAGKQSVA